MMNKVLTNVVLLLGLTIASVPWASAQTSTPNAGEPAAVEVAKADVAATKVDRNKQVICRKFAPTGSRIGKKVCRTREAWTEMQRNAQNRIDKATLPQSNNQKGG